MNLTQCFSRGAQRFLKKKNIHLMKKGRIKSSLFINLTDRIIVQR